eukprot:CAMPEP_0182897688 /NCGR_PEP_ID=MMETSP0034_2-20130328/27033_1 /TAXON_ID=156128 /ORGANISM="Nephroselmis pyriformis, Strain CCMP717" /LENGTH=557 /DNA_ID=CAMNT_0025031621 /DNA_START=117 /DNA_END=1786 /DNA_ORIENTATION=-
MPMEKSKKSKWATPAVIFRGLDIFVPQRLLQDRQNAEDGGQHENKKLALLATGVNTRRNTTREVLQIQVQAFLDHRTLAEVDRDERAAEKARKTGGSAAAGVQKAAEGRSLLTHGCTDLGVPPFSTSGPRLVDLERAIMETIHGPPQSGNRLDMPPGNNPTPYRWVLKNPPKRTDQEEQDEHEFMYEGMGVKITFLPTDQGCPKWADPRVKLMPEEEAAVKDLDALLAPRVLVDPSMDPLSPEQDLALWGEVMANRPWLARQRRLAAQRMLVRKLAAKLPEHIHEEGLHGLWELMNTKEQALELELPVYEAISRVLHQSEDPANVSLAAILVWTLAKAAETREQIVRHKGVEGILRCLELGLALAGPPRSGESRHVAALSLTERQAARDRLIASGTGALAVLVCDKAARRALLLHDSRFECLTSVLYLNVTDLVRHDSDHLRALTSITPSEESAQKKKGAAAKSFDEPMKEAISRRIVSKRRSSAVGGIQVPAQLASGWEVFPEEKEEEAAMAAAADAGAAEAGADAKGDDDEGGSAGGAEGEDSAKGEAVGAMGGG